jgi:hypothetical protein
MTWEDIKLLLLNGTSQEVSHLTSPDGEPLIVTFTPGSRRALSIRCKKGWPSMVMDGIDSDPPWTKELGNRIETSN